ncbi:hypothetical protein NQ318_011182 [Aromia moschata]|uniref:Uncharacterized protein n=1 Tax=Aromia moschata TaxID=1265417 RepID=A0AAV8YK32_9CUCU|nr:hypothetical protein NQ318_011182 [Aromia moschata]
MSGAKERVMQRKEPAKRLTLEQKLDLINHGKNGVKNVDLQDFGYVDVECITLIAKYSGILEPVANALQSKTIDMYTCTNHIKRIISVIKNHRGNADREKQQAAIGTDLQIPRTAGRQQHRSNHPAENSLISALEQRFSNEHLPGFSLMSLHTNSMINMTVVDFKEKSQDFCQYYDLPLF